MELDIRLAILKAIISLINNYNTNSKIEDNTDDIELLYKETKILDGNIKNISKKLQGFQNKQESNLFLNSHDNNFDVSNPSNGYYISWEKERFQICLDHKKIIAESYEKHKVVDIVYPAAFSNVKKPIVFPTSSKDFEIVENTSNYFTLDVDFTENIDKELFEFYYIAFGK